MARCLLHYLVIELFSLKTIWNQLCSQKWECCVRRMLKAFAIHWGLFQRVVDVTVSDWPGMSPYYSSCFVLGECMVECSLTPNSVTSFLCAEKTLNFIPRKGHSTQNMSLKSVSSLLLLWVHIAWIILLETLKRVYLFNLNYCLLPHGMLLFFIPTLDFRAKGTEN